MINLRHKLLEIISFGKLTNLTALTSFNITEHFVIDFMVQACVETSGVPVFIW